MTLSLITPTRNRPRSFALVEECMRGQTEPYNRWIIANDGREKYHTIAPAVSQQTNAPGAGHSLCLNVKRALSACLEADLIAVIEDDDWYSPDYLATLKDAMEPGIDLVGACPANYYHLPSRRYQCLSNRNHASLGMSMFRASLIPQVLDICNRGSPFIDIPLWAQTPTHAKRLIPSTGSDGRLLHVGLKGCPGEPGIGMGHRSKLPKEDPEGKWLRHHLGTSATAWLSLVEQPSSKTPGAGAASG